MQIQLQEPYKQFFGTLANQIRLDIIKLLRIEDNNVNAIVESLGYSQPTISHNLKRLEECGFVQSTPKGKERIYSLNRKTIKPLFKLMEDHMDSFCKHVVKERRDHK